MFKKKSVYGLKKTILLWCQNNEETNSCNSKAIKELKVELERMLPLNNQHIISVRFSFSLFLLNFNALLLRNVMIKNDYLINFGKTLTTSIENSLNESWKAQDLHNLNMFDAEIMHHAIYCDNVLKKTIGRDKILLKVRNEIFFY